MTDEYRHICYDKQDDGVAIVTFNEPDKLNTIGHGAGSMADELVRALADAAADATVGCVIVTGNGRAFSAGGNTDGWTLDDSLDWLRFLEVISAELEAVRNSRKPTIGAINGICYGLGLTLATHLDLLLAVDTAQFGLIETRFGATGAQTLPFLVGPQWARFLALSGEVISASKAKEIGLLLEVFPEDVFWPKALDLGRRIAAMPREAVVLNRRVINGSLTMQGWDNQREFALGINTITTSIMKYAKSADGRVLADVRRDHGWEEYKKARDAAFTPPWLDG